MQSEFCDTIGSKSFEDTYKVIPLYFDEFSTVVINGIFFPDKSQLDQSKAIYQGLRQSQFKAIPPWFHEFFAQASNVTE